MWFRFFDRIGKQRCCHTLRKWNNSKTHVGIVALLFVLAVTESFQHVESIAARKAVRIKNTHLTNSIRTLDKGQQLLMQQQETVLRATVPTEELQQQPITTPTIDGNKKRTSIRRVIINALKADKNKKLFVMSVAGMNGLSDVLYLSRYNGYVNMVTGSTVKGLTGYMSGIQSDAVFYAWICIAYTIGAGISARQSEYVKKNTIKYECRTAPPAHPICLAVAPFIWLLFMIADVISFSGSRYGAAPLAAAYGIVNTISTEVSGGSILWALTGHFKNIGQRVYDLIKPRNGNKIPMDELDKIFRPMFYHSKCILAFAVGVYLGLRLFASAPALLELTPVPLQWSAFSVRTFLDWKYFPINTVFGAFYVFSFLWYGQNGNKK